MKENQFDKLAKGVAQSVTRRQALKKFAVGLAGMALACFSLANMAQAKGKRRNCLPFGSPCEVGGKPCCWGLYCSRIGHGPAHVCLGYTQGGYRPV